MRNRVIFLILGFISISTSSSYAADRYRVESSLSSIHFKVSHFGISFVQGQFNKFSGIFIVEGDTLKQFDGTVDMTSLNSGLRARDNDLKSDNFFAAKRFPQMFIQSSHISQKQNKIIVKCNLTIRDTTQPVELRGDMAPSNEDKGSSVDLFMEGIIERNKFGLRLNKIFEFFVSDKVNITLKLRAVPEPTGAMN